MKILQVGKYYYPSHGGIETVLRNLSEGLVAAGHEVTVLCSAEEPRRVEETIDGVRVIRAPYLGKAFSQPLTPTLPVELSRLARGMDLVHVHSPNPLAETSCLTLPASQPLLVSYHSDIVRQRLFLPLYAPLLRKFLHRCSRIVVATKNHVLHSPFLIGMQERCEVIPYGIQSRASDPGPELASRIDELRLRHGRFVLFVGRLVGYKGVPVLIEAMRHVNANAVIVGAGPLRAELEAQARNAQVLDRIHFAGYVDGVDIEAYYRACSILVLPSVSKNEAFGLVQIEAMACSKPTIATKLDSGITEVNEPGVTGLQVPPSDPVALAAAIGELLSDPERLSAMGGAARRRFEERFTRERMVGSYDELYRRLLASSSEYSFSIPRT